MDFNLPILVNYPLRKTEGTVASEEVSEGQFSVQDSHFPYETKMTGDPFQVPIKKMTQHGKQTGGISSLCTAAEQYGWIQAIQEIHTLH